MPDNYSVCSPLSSSASLIMVIVPAHNEEQGIGATLKSLQANREAVVTVVADNCTDRTAEIAGSFGVRVIVRNEPGKAGKPYALNYALGILMKEGYHYFAFVDADTIVESNFSSTLLAAFHRGAEAIQVCYAHKKDSLTTRQRLLDIGFYAASTLRPLGRQYWGLSCGILGNGFALRRELLAAIPFPADSIVEDLSYHLLLVSNNVKVTYVPETVVRAEMPSSPAGIRTQRARWEGGRLNALAGYGLPLLQAILTSGNARLIEPLLDLLLPPLTIQLVFVLLLFLFPHPYVHAYAWFALAIIAGYCFTTLLMRKEGWKDWAALCAAPLFVLWKLTMIPGILMAAGKPSWKRTERNQGEHMDRRYLLVTHIPFMRIDDGIVVDQLWANDLAELTRHVGPIHLAAPEIPASKGHETWGPKVVAIDPSLPITFVGFPPMSHSWELWTRWKIHRVLKKEVALADIVHSSNLFNPYLGLLYAHFLAARLNKKTVFVVAEDYHDSLIWEWVRISNNGFQRWVRSLVVDHMDRLMQKAVSTASLALLFTPAAVKRFRLYAKNGVAVRDTTHSEKDIVNDSLFAFKCQEILAGHPLKLISACRHKPLKGVEYTVRAVAELKRRGIYVEADLFGHGPLTTQLKDLARRLDVDDRVRFPGSLSADQEVYSAFADRHVSLMPHRTNEFARALYDALAGGTPVVAFHTAASEGSIRDGVDGILTPLDNAIALAVAIERLHNDRKLLVLLAQNARERAFMETRTIWHQFRAGLIEELFWEDIPE